MDPLGGFPFQPRLGPGLGRPEGWEQFFPGLGDLRPPLVESLGGRGTGADPGNRHVGRSPPGSWCRSGTGASLPPGGNRNFYRPGSGDQRWALAATVRLRPGSPGPRNPHQPGIMDGHRDPPPGFPVPGLGEAFQSRHLPPRRHRPRHGGPGILLSRDPGPSSGWSIHGAGSRGTQWHRHPPCGGLPGDEWPPDRGGRSSPGGRPGKFTRSVVDPPGGHRPGPSPGLRKCRRASGSPEPGQASRDGHSGFSRCR